MPIEQQSLSLQSALQNELVAKIEEMIRSGEHDRSGRLREAVLSRLLGVSRTPVRAALQYLVSEGVLQPHHLGGYIVIRTPPVSGTTLASNAQPTGLYGRILRDIILNNFADPASEIAIMRKYATSRGEVVRVLKRLVREDLAEPLPGRGWAMLKFDAKQMSRSYHLRAILEPALLIDRDFEVDAETLCRLRAEQVQAINTLSPNSSWPELFEIDAALHESLARGSGNDMIVDIVKRQNRIRRLAEFFSYSRIERIRRSMNEHVAILDALLSGDRGWASALMRQHLSVSRNETEENLTRDLDAVWRASSGIERLE